jgi:hypothetical protein
MNPAVLIIGLERKRNAANMRAVIIRSVGLEKYAF